jgi:hypothetical protein
MADLLCLETYLLIIVSRFCDDQLPGGLANCTSG